MLWLNRLTSCAEGGDVAVVPVGQPLGQLALDGLGGGGQVLLPGGGQREPASSPARPLSLPPQQPGRDQLLELPGHGGLVQAEVGGQVGRARLGRDVDLGQQRRLGRRKIVLTLTPRVSYGPGLSWRGGRFSRQRTWSR